MHRTKRTSLALPDETRHTVDGNTSRAVDWTYSTAIKIFNLEDSVPEPIGGMALAPMHPDQLLSGFLCQAARDLLGVSQTWLWSRANVSKKTINDFENGFIRPKPALVIRIRTALEAGGASFVEGRKVIGVIVYRRKPEELETEAG